MIKIALDAGHGLNTAGKQTPDGIKEWTLNDKVRDKVCELLSAYDCEIIHTDGNEGKTDESLSSRVAKYKSAGVSAFVSIHHNAFTGNWNGATGVEVYTDNNPTTKDLRLADCIYGRLVNYTGLKARGIKRANFAVINQNTIPAVLVEGGFMDGTNDYKVITSEAGQTAYAKAVAEGLIEFLGLSLKPSKPLKAEVEVVKTPDVIYAAHTLKGKWLSDITNYNDKNAYGYAGITGKSIDGIRAKLTNGNIVYRVHTVGGKYLDWVRNQDKAQGGYAGLYGYNIDGLQMYLENLPGFAVEYRVAPIGKPYLAWVRNYKDNDPNGYAGIYGKAIDRIQIRIVKV